MVDPESGGEERENQMGKKTRICGGRESREEKAAAGDTENCQRELKGNWTGSQFLKKEEKPLETRPMGTWEVNSI